MNHTYSLIACLWLISLVVVYFAGKKHAISDIKYLLQKAKEDEKLKRINGMETEELIATYRECVKKEDFNNCIKLRDVLKKRGIEVEL